MNVVSVGRGGGKRENRGQGWIRVAGGHVCTGQSQLSRGEPPILPPEWLMMLISARIYMKAY